MGLNRKPRKRITDELPVLDASALPPAPAGKVDLRTGSDRRQVFTRFPRIERRRSAARSA
jgi:hypothetical protein